MKEVLPAYGRDYGSALSAKADWFAGKDFIEAETRLACNIQDLPDQDILIRYGKLAKIAHVEFAKDKKAYEKAKAADRATRPVNTDFEGWMKALDKAVIAECGLSYQDLPDWDFRAAFDNGIAPEAAARSVLDEAGF
jgi:hypothetical protein